jgi:hypothetical protein
MPYSRFLQFPRLPLFLLCSANLIQGSAANAGDKVVYENDFNARLGTAYPEWSSSQISFSNRNRQPGSGDLNPQTITNVESPKAKRRFLGEFGGPRVDPTARTRVKQTVSLSLKELPPHASATVAFDLLILKSWDGSSPQYGPDRFSLAVADGPVLLNATFSNNPKLDADSSYQSYPTPRSRPQAGAVAVQTLGYRFFGDSVYHFRLSFPHDAQTLRLDFASDLFEGKGTADESWGLDDVRVSISTERVGGQHPRATTSPR